MKKITIAISYIGAITILCMALLTGVDVAGRYVLNKPVQGGFELIELMMVVIIACGVAIATAADDHIRVDSLYDKLSPFGKHLFRLFAGLACMIIFALLSWQGIYGWMDAVDAKKATAILGIPVSPFQLLLTVGFFISFIFSFIQIMSLLRRQKR